MTTSGGRSSAWCGYERGRRRHAAGTCPASLPDYLSQTGLAAGVSHSTLRVIAAAIAHQHTDSELPNPCEDPAVESVLADSERSALRSLHGRVRWTSRRTGRSERPPSCRGPAGADGRRAGGARRTAVAWTSR